MLNLAYIDLPKLIKFKKKKKKKKKKKLKIFRFFNLKPNLPDKS
jgi:hypothetical protein